MYIEREKHILEEHTMKKINLFEDAIANECKNLIAAGIEPTVFWAYRHSMRNGNELIDFADVIWDEDIKAIADTLDENGITEFTISSTFSGLIATLAAFDKQDFKMAGITEVNANYTDWMTNERARVPAIRLTQI